MTQKERKVVFTLIGIMALVLILVLIVKGVGGKKEVNANGLSSNGNSSNQVANTNAEQYVTSLENGIKINNSEQLNNSKKYKNIELSDIQFTSQDGRSMLLAKAKNIGSSYHDAEIVKLTILDATNQEMTVIYPVLPKMAAGETKQFYAEITADVIKAKDFKIEAK